MIDLQAHWLVGAPDGPRSRDEALRLAEEAVQDGVRVAVVGSRIDGSRRRLTPDQYWTAFERLGQWLQEEANPLVLVPSMVVRVAPNLVEGYRRGQFLCLGKTRYCCVELPPNECPVYAFEVFEQMRAQGDQILLLHPEKNRAIRRAPELMARLAALGAVGVASAGSLTGQWGEEVTGALWRLMDSGWIQTVASDGEPGRPRVRLSTVRELLCRRYGEREAFRTMTEVPDAILQGLPVPPAAREPLGWQRWLSSPQRLPVGGGLSVRGM
ncbi:MAG: hypothetical protein OWU84_07340 [Firmicutes bacterium]|nr:hypothetical protein [Bacillota bacterium]